MSQDAFPGFKVHRSVVPTTTSGPVEIYARVGGSGPPLVLLGGYPQTHRMWRRVTPALAERFTVIVADIRGYGQSGKPRGSSTHEEYSKREMAKDILHLMKDLGHVHFDIMAHDRGAHVAHHLAVNHPDTVGSLMILDIAPSLFIYDHVNMLAADAWFHWFFLTQSSPEAENVIIKAPKEWWQLYGRKMNFAAAKWTLEDEQEYFEACSSPEGVHGICEDYRAGETIDLEHEREDIRLKRGISVRKLKIVWGNGLVPQMRNPIDIWRDISAPHVDISGQQLDSGHYIPEQCPEELVKIALKFFDSTA